MKASSLARLARHCLLASVAPLAVVACSAAPPPAHADEPLAESSSEAITKNPCGLTPKAPVCNLPKCTPDGWVYLAIPNGSSCMTSAGAPGLCEGGNASTETMGRCVMTISGELEPKYYALQVLYAPPGTASNVVYGSGQTFGTTTTAKDSFTNALTLSVSNKSNVLGFGAGGLSVSTSRTDASDSSTAVTVTSTTQTTLPITGLSDAVNHDLDQIYLWLNPQVNITANGNLVSWDMSVRDGQQPIVVYVTPAWLKGISPMPAGVAYDLAAANITASDYPTLLALDPYANGNPTLDPARYVYQTWLPYEAVTEQGQTAALSTFTLNKAMSTVNTMEASTEYSVDVTVKGSVAFGTFVSLNLSAEDKMTWKSENDFSKTTGSTLSAVASIMQPEYGYSGPARVNVYLDTIYNSFLFVVSN
jgi:hypothetical protein